MNTAKKGGRPFDPPNITMTTTLEATNNLLVNLFQLRTSSEINFRLSK